MVPSAAIHVSDITWLLIFDIPLLTIKVSYEDCGPACPVAQHALWPSMPCGPACPGPHCLYCSIVCEPGLDVSASSMDKNSIVEVMHGD